MNIPTIPVTPIGVTPKGRIVWADADGNREFSPVVQRRVWLASVAFVALFILLALGLVTGLIPAAPWSPIGKASS